MADIVQDWVRFQDFREKRMACLLLERRDEHHCELGRILQEEGPCGVQRLITQWTHEKYPNVYCVGMHPMPEYGAWGFVCIHDDFPEHLPSYRLPVFYIRARYNGDTVTMALEDDEGNG